MTRTPPRGKWWCTKCARPVANGIAVSMDPRFATGLCLHGTSSTETDPERVPLVTTEAKASEVMDQRAEARAVTRALRKQVSGKDLSANEQAALARRDQARAS